MNLKDLQYRYGLGRAIIDIIVWVHSLLMYCFDAVVLLLVPRTHRGSERRRVLIIKLELIGDFILWLDFARGLREFYPPATHELTLLANRSWADLAEGSDLFDRVLPLQRMRFILNPVYRFRELMRIRREGFDVLIDPTFSREFQFGPPVARISGAPIRVAPEGDASNQRSWQKKISDRWYTRLLPSSNGARMELVRNAEFLRQLGHTEFRAGLPVYRPKAISVQNAKEPYYVIFPGASWANKQWPAGNFAALARLIHQATGWQGVICGGLGEEHLARQLMEATDVPLVDRTGQTTLDQLAAIIAGARLLVGNDTSAVHLAVAVSTPAVCMLGGGHFGRLFPYQVEDTSARPTPSTVYHQMPCYGCNWHCIYSIKGQQPFPCIAGITVKDAWECVQSHIP